jgi:hypothetical protein
MAVVELVSFGCRTSFVRKRAVGQLLKNSNKQRQGIGQGAMNKVCHFTYNKSLKVVRVRSLDSFSQRMLRILCAAFRCPLAQR